jgi:hypothetical protein
VRLAAPSDREFPGGFPGHTATLGWVLSHVEITARVTVTPVAHFVWSNRLEYRYDCFVCQRVGRMVSLHPSAEHGLCHSSERRLEWQDEQAIAGSHPAPIRVTGFETAETGPSLRLRCRLSFWWAPFTDLKRRDVRASELGGHRWVQLHYRVGCHTCRDAGHDDWFGPQSPLQTDQVWPVTTSCPRCTTELVTVTGPPEIDLVG